jgi:hypothetical protein
LREIQGRRLSWLWEYNVALMGTAFIEAGDKRIVMLTPASSTSWVGAKALTYLMVRSS